MNTQPVQSQSTNLCLVALGANRGDCQRAVETALERLAGSQHSRLLRNSSFYRTAPIGGPEGQGEFINAAALIETQLPIPDVLHWLLEIERSFGRRRTQRWGAREIDLDILLYGDQMVATASVEVPHPRMAYRRFVLEPAAEISPDMMHPSIGWSMQELLTHLNTTPFLLAFAPDGNARSELATEWAKKVAKKFDAFCLLDDQTSDPIRAIDKHRRDVCGIVANFIPEHHSPKDAPRLVVQFPRHAESSRHIVGPCLQLPQDASVWEQEISAAFQAMK